jgi:hypothetical protein
MSIHAKPNENSPPHCWDSVERLGEGACWSSPQAAVSDNTCLHQEGRRRSYPCSSNNGQIGLLINKTYLFYFGLGFSVVRLVNTISVDP